METEEMMEVEEKEVIFKITDTYRSYYKHMLLNGILSLDPADKESDLPENNIVGFDYAIIPFIDGYSPEIAINIFKVFKPIYEKKFKDGGSIFIFALNLVKDFFLNSYQKLDCIYDRADLENCHINFQNMIKTVDKFAFANLVNFNERLAEEYGDHVSSGRKIL